MNETQLVFTKLYGLLRAGQNAVVATVVQSYGSTPRGAGAKMLVAAGEPLVGTVGGGAAEYAAIQQANELLKTRRCLMREYRMHPGETDGTGMVCGGGVRVYFAFFSARDEEKRARVAKACEALQKNGDSWLQTSINEDGFDIAVFTRPGPHRVGNAVFLAKEGRFIEPLAQTGAVYAFGGGHVSQALVPALSAVDFRVIVMENRAEFARPALFPGAFEVTLCDFNDCFRGRRVTDNDYIAIMTRGHQGDYGVLAQALNTPATYIGMIGSKTKIALTKKAVLEAGFTEADFSRVNSPIGLAISAQTPAEIAVSIAAELIAHRAKRNAGSS
jgi:xanthine dehydrogenase accessory factor